MHTEGSEEERAKRYGYALSVLFLLFCFRVLAQLIQAMYPVSFLPPFHAWQSGALSYGLLLSSQIMIIAFFVHIMGRLFQGRIQPSRRKGRICLYLGMVYFLVMIIRLILGLTIARDHFWFRAQLPTVFHLVLAMFVLVYGHYHYQFGSASKNSVMVTP